MVWFVEMLVETWKASVWPLIVAFLIIRFEKELRSVVKRLTEVTFPGGAMRFDPLRGDNSPEPKNELGSGEDPPIAAVSGNPFHVFWLAHDLMWTRDVLLRDAPRERVIHGLRTAISHLEQVGLPSTAMCSQLNQILAQVTTAEESRLDATARVAISNEIARITMMIGGN